MAYLTLAEFKAVTLIPDAVIDAVEISSPGFVAGQLEETSGWIDAQLGKRYDIPFAPPAPSAVRRWLQKIVTRDVLLKRGLDPTDEQAAEYVKQAEAAEAEIQKAAEAQNGLYELPLAATGKSGVSKGGTRGYSEASPYVFTDVQAGVAHDEDRAGRGSS